MSTVTAGEGPSPPLGVRVSLPPGTLAAQREKELARRSQHNQQQQQQQQVQAVEEDEEEEHDDEGPRPIGIDLDREIVPFHLGGGDGDGNSCDDSSDAEPGLQDEDDASSSAASDDIDDDDDDISQSPPTSLPLLSIDLIELTGCKPSNAEEKSMLVDQVRAILVGKHNEDGSAGEEEAKR